MELAQLNETAQAVLRGGGVFVPSPLALDSGRNFSEEYQRLLTIYYIRAGARAVIPGAHTGEFAGGNIELLRRWMRLVRETTAECGGAGTMLMAAAGGPEARAQAECAAREEYDLVMVAPTAFAGMDARGVIGLMRDIASIIPVFGFELQRAIPGSYAFTKELWKELFTIVRGAKGASFDTSRSIAMLEAAAESDRRDELTLLTGNDDRIVSDIAGLFPFMVSGKRIVLKYSGGLLGHFATDTNAAVRMVADLKARRDHGTADASAGEKELAHAVNRCNMALFDAAGNFENSVWGVKYRLTRAGLLPGPYCFHETGRPGQDEEIDRIYGLYPSLSDDRFLAEHLETMKREAGIHRQGTP